MKRSYFRFIPVLIFPILSSCGGPSTIRISHLFSSDVNQLDRMSALRNMYVQGNRTNLIQMNGKIVFQGSGGSQSLGPGFSIQMGPLCKALQKRINWFGGRVAAYRSVPPKENADPFIDLIQPSCFLRIDLNPIQVNVDEIKNSVQKTDSKGVTKTETTSTWKTRVATRVMWRLESYPSRQNWAGDSVAFYREYPSSQRPGDGNLPGIHQDIVAFVADNLASRIVPVHPVVRMRPLFVVKKDTESVSSVRLAYGGDWTGAEKIWERRNVQNPNTWQDWNNLAVAAERRRVYAEALRCYREAERLSAGAKEARLISWSQIWDDLQKASSVKFPTEPTKSTWFSKRLAVLPFSDETTSLNGPDTVRAGVFKILKDGGYNVIPLNTVDATLRDHGFSDAGQFVATSPQNIAKWLEADAMFFGHITDFNDANIGIYAKRSIKGDIKYYDTVTQNNFWSSAKPYVIQSIPTSVQAIATNFLANLGKTFIEKATRHHMAAESQAFAEINLESFPLQP